MDFVASLRSGSKNLEFTNVKFYPNHVSSKSGMAVYHKHGQIVHQGICIDKHNRAAETSVNHAPGKSVTECGSGSDFNEST